MVNLESIIQELGHLVVLAQNNPQGAAFVLSGMVIATVAVAIYSRWGRADARPAAP